MLATITAERPDTPDALLLIDELQTHLESFYPPESRHGFSVERLIKEGVTFFVLWVEDPVDHEGVHVDVELKAAAEALDHCHRAGPAVLDAVRPRGARVVQAGC